MSKDYALEKRRKQTYYGIAVTVGIVSGCYFLYRYLTNKNENEKEDKTTNEIEQKQDLNTDDVVQTVQSQEYKQPIRKQTYGIAAIATVEIVIGGYFLYRYLTNKNDEKNEKIKETEEEYYERMSMHYMKYHGQ
eukprot:152045_1